MLTQAQELSLERLQRNALRDCFGHGVPVEESMRLRNVQTLKERRERRCDAFIRKAAANARLAPSWFPARDTGENVELRNRQAIQETRAVTLRRFNSPLAFMRRRANQIGLIPETWQSQRPNK